MRYFILIIFLLPSPRGLSQLLFSSEGNYLNGTENPSEIIRANKIRKEIIYTYYSMDNKATDSVLTDSILYNSRGQVLESSENLQYPRFKATKKYFYDSLGRVYRVFEDHEYPKNYTLIYEFAFDNAGREIIDYTYDVDTSFLLAERKYYDEAGKLICINRGNTTTPMHTEVTFSYSDITGLLEKVVHYFPNGMKARTYEYSFGVNANERKIVEIGKGYFHLFEESFLDEQGRVARTISEQMKTIVDHHGNRSQEPNVYESVLATFSYNPDGTLSEWVVYRGKKLKAVTRHYYLAD
jgi:hypothetical protein